MDTASRVQILSEVLLPEENAAQSAGAVEYTDCIPAEE